MSPTQKALAGLIMLVAACSGDPLMLLEPNSGPPATPASPEPEVATAPAQPTPAALTLPACATHHWATATGGSWSDAARWTPQSVPGGSSIACIDAAGTYTVTLQMRPSDAVPVALNGLVIGGAASGTQTLALGGVAAARERRRGHRRKAHWDLVPAGNEGHRRHHRRRRQRRHDPDPGHLRRVR